MENSRDAGVGMLVGGVTSYKMNHPAACRRLQLSSQIHNQNISAHHQKWEFEKVWVLRGREGNVMLSGGCEGVRMFRPVLLKLLF